MYKLKVGLKRSKKYSNLSGSLSIDYSKLQSHIQSLLTKSVEIASGVLLVCFIILRLIASVVYR